MATALTALGAPTGVPAADPEPEPLADVREAYEYLQACRERAERAKSVFVQVVIDADLAGHGPRAIAAQLGVTRQYVQKVIREYWAAEAENEKREAELAASVKRKDRLSGWHENPQCSGCRRLLSRPDQQCPGCGYVNGGGYLGVPATVSHLERWR